MATLRTQLNTRSPEYAANREAMLAQVDELRALLTHTRQGGGAKAQERHTGKGKLLLIIGLGVFPGAIFNVTDDAVQIIGKAFVAEGH